MGWGAFNPRPASRRSRSLGTSEWSSQLDIGPLGDRIASGDSCNTPLGWHQGVETPLGERSASYAAGQAHTTSSGVPAFRNDSSCSSQHELDASPAFRQSLGSGGSLAAPAAPRSEASCSTGVSFEHGSLAEAHGGGSEYASPNRSPQGVAPVAGSPKLPHRQQQVQQGGPSFQQAHPGAVIAGGAGEGDPHQGLASPSQQPEARPDPIENHQRYRKLRDLNWGTSGFVQLALDMQTGQQVAIKFISRGRQHVDVNMKEISRELLNQRMCALHPNIVQLQEVFLTQDYLAVAMEYADGGDLSEHIDSQYSKGIDFMSEDDARWIFQQLIIAVDYCHRLGIANRDIKLDNMLLHGPWPRPALKLCDFGFSKNEVVQSVSKSTCGTPEYMAPEVLFEMKYNGQDADVWSCGVSLYVLMTGVFPFSRPTDEAEGATAGGNTRVMRHMFRRIIAGDYFPVPELSAEAQHLIHHMFRPNPAERCTTEDIMAHPWFTKNLPPELAQLNDRLLAAKAQEHQECRRSIADLDRFTGHPPPQQGAGQFHNRFSAANRRGGS